MAWSELDGKSRTFEVSDAVVTQRHDGDGTKERMEKAEWRERMVSVSAVRFEPGLIAVLAYQVTSELPIKGISSRSGFQIGTLRQHTA